MKSVFIFLLLVSFVSFYVKAEYWTPVEESFHGKQHATASAEDQATYGGGIHFKDDGQSFGTEDSSDFDFENFWQDIYEENANLHDQHSTNFGNDYFGDSDRYL